MEDVVKLLEEMGLTKTEAIVYLTLVKKGSSTAYRLSKDANIYKANTYMAIEGLIRKNLVVRVDIQGKSLLRAVPPEDFVLHLDRQKEKFEQVLPQIERNFQDEYNDVAVFSGVETFFNILHSLLEEKESIYAFDIPSFVPQIVQTHIGKFHVVRIKKKIKMYHIYDYDAKERIALLKKMPHTYAKCNVQNRFSAVSTIVCGKITLITNWKNLVKTVKIVDRDIADAYRQQFDVLWNPRLK